MRRSSHFPPAARFPHFATTSSSASRPINSLANNAVVARGGKEKDNEASHRLRGLQLLLPSASARRRRIRSGHQCEAGRRRRMMCWPIRKFAQGRIVPYAVNEADVWTRKYKVSQVLGLYREHYAPAADSPLASAGDPADGKNSYIGAIGPGKHAPHDRFGASRRAKVELSKTRTLKNRQLLGKTNYLIQYSRMGEQVNNCIWYHCLVRSETFVEWQLHTSMRTADFNLIIAASIHSLALQS